MSSSINLPKTRAFLYGGDVEIDGFWVEKGLIPLGSLYPPYKYKNKDEYPNGIPICIDGFCNNSKKENHVVTIPFEIPDGRSFTSMDQFNLLILGGSGDGKGMLTKVIWAVMAEAGYKVCYIDAKGREAARATKSWKSPNLPPFTKPKGIPLAHFMPHFSLARVDKNILHNFRLYSQDLSTMDSAELWMSIGMQSQGASFVARVIRDANNVGDEVNLHYLQEEIKEATEDDLSDPSKGNVNRILSDVYAWELIKPRSKVLNLYNEWQKKNSIVISFNMLQDKRWMIFDIGYLIKEASTYFDKYGIIKPILFIFDDASKYLRKVEGVNINIAMSEVTSIGNDGRSKGINSILEVQSLGLIDEDVAESYKTIIISPYFKKPDSLKNINIPQEAIDLLRNGSLIMNKETKPPIIQWILITRDGKIVPFFPFTPGCNHFTNIDLPKQEVAEC